MWISQIELEAIKSYGQKVKIELRPGVNAICGQNGAGKSTILEAIGFALFGTLPYNQAQFVNGQAKKGEIIIGVINRQDERFYQVVRPVKGTAPPYVYDPETGQRLAEGTDDVRRWLCDCMGVEATTDLAALFENAVGVPQGLLTASFLQTEAKRKPIFDPLLGVEDYKQVWDNLLAVVRQVEELQTKNESEQRFREGKLGDLPTYRQQVQELEQTIQTKESEDEQLAQALADLDRELAKLQAQQEMIQALTQRSDRLAEQVKGLEPLWRDAQARLAEAERASEIVAQCQAGYEAYEAAQAEQPGLEKRRQEREAGQQRRVNVEQELALIQQTVKTLTGQLEGVRAAEVRLIELAPLAANQERLDHERQQAEKAVAELEVAEQRVAAEKIRLTDLTTHLAEAQTQLSQRQLLAQQIAACQQQRRQQAEALAGLEQEAKTLGQQLDETRRALVEAQQRLTLYQATQTRLEEEAAAQARRQTELDKMQAELAERNELEVALHSLQAIRRERHAELSTLAGQMSDQEAAEQRVQADLDTWKAQAQALQHHQANLSTAQNRLAAAEQTLADLNQGWAQRLELALQIQTLEAEQTETSQQRDMARSEVARSQTQLEALDQAMASLTVEAGSPCPVCQKPLAGHELESLQAHYEAEQQRVETALETAGAQLKLAEARLKSLANQIKKIEAKRDKLPTESQLDNQQQGVAVCQTEVAELAQQVTALAHAPAQTEQQRQLLQQLQAKLAQLKQEQAALKQADEADEQRQHELQAEIGNLPRPADLQKVQNEIAQAENNLTSWQEKIKELCHAPQTAAHLQNTAAELAARHAQLQVQQAEVAQRREELADEAQRLQGDMNDLATPARVEELQAAAETQAHTLTEWQANVAKLSEARPHLTAIQEALAALGDPRGEQQVKRAEAEKRSGLEAELAQKQTEWGQQKQIQITIAAELTAFADLEAALQRSQAAFVAHKAAHQTYLEQRPVAATLVDRQNQANTSQANLEAVQAELRQVQQDREQTAAGYDPADHQASQKRRQDKERQAIEVATELKSQRKSWQQVQAKIQQLEQIEAEWLELQAEAERLKRLHEVVTFIRRTIKEAGPEVTKRLVKAISFQADHIFADLMHDPLMQLTWDETYAIMVSRDGYERSYQQLSGGEAMAAALAVRLALLQGMSTVDVAFFDEPTANLDSERRANLAEQISRIKGFSQLVVISHDDTFEQDTDHVVHIGKDEQGYSRVTG